MERDNLQFMLTCGIGGLFYSPEDLSAEEFTELTATAAFPSSVRSDGQGVNADAVLVDNSDVVHKTVTRLIEKGHSASPLSPGRNPCLPPGSVW